ncbi:hypothetical protein LINGRAPRIM_LOCUS1472 [Linum grandiflorum]
MVKTSSISPSPITTADTDHSKFTAKCGVVSRCKECYVHPCTKSKDKAKGAHKLRSHDVTSDHRLIMWRVVGGGHVSSADGFSASEMLDGLVSVDRYFDVDEARFETDGDDDDDDDDEI